MSLRDLVHKVPGTKKEITNYILQNYAHVRAAVESNPQHMASLENAVNESFDKHFRYLGHLTGKISGAGHAVGYAADAWLLTGDIVGSLGGKFLNLLAQLPEKAYGLVYGVSTGNYLDAAQCLLEGAVSYLPGLTFVDQGLERIVKNRMVKDALTRFEKDAGLYEPWTSRLKGKLSPVYAGVKDRSGNVFRPSYQPA